MVAVNLRHSKPANGVTLEIEFDQHGGLVANHPPVVTRFDRHRLGSRELDRAAIRILNVDLAASEESDVCVHAQLGSGDRFHVRGPAKPSRVDNAFYPALAGTHDVDLNTTDLAAGCFGNGRQ